jgi:hypothetical protein
MNVGPIKPQPPTAPRAPELGREPTIEQLDALIQESLHEGTQLQQLGQLIPLPHRMEAAKAAAMRGEGKRPPIQASQLSGLLQRAVAQATTNAHHGEPESAPNAHRLVERLTPILAGMGQDVALARQLVEKRQPQLDPRTVAMLKTSEEVSHPSLIESVRRQLPPTPPAA